MIKIKAKYVTTYSEFLRCNQIFDQRFDPIVKITDFLLFLSNWLWSILLLLLLQRNITSSWALRRRFSCLRCRQEIEKISSQNHRSSFYFRFLRRNFKAIELIEALKHRFSKERRQLFVNIHKRVIHSLLIRNI